jgi:hypothetical protein
LFLATVAHYGETRIAQILRWLDGETDAQKHLEGFFDDLISLATGHPDMTGCLIACVLAEAAGKCLKMRVVLSVRFATDQSPKPRMLPLRPIRQITNDLYRQTPDHLRSPKGQAYA